MTTEIYLINAAGFLLQLYPCAMMCFLPFGRDRLKAGKGRIFCLVTFIALALSALFPVVTTALASGGYMSFNALTNYYMLFGIVLVAAAFILLVREHFSKKLLVVYVAILYAALIYWLANFFSDIGGSLINLPHPNINSAYELSHIVFYIISMFTVFPFAYVFMCRSVAAFLREIGPEQIRMEFRFVTLSTLAFLALMMFADTTQAIGNAIILFLILNQGLIYWMIFVNAVNRCREENAQRALQLQKLQYGKISADMERDARMRHDMHHHWNYLYSLAENGNLDGIKSYLASLSDQTNRRENEIFCKNSTVNALLQYYIGIARERGIACSVSAQCGEMNVLPEDLTVIIGNILENAIRSCLKAGGNMFIDIAAAVLHGEFVFEVANSCSEVRLAAAGRKTEGFLPASAFLSMRDGGGRGIAGVSGIAEKYLGAASFKYDPESRSFTTRVILSKI